MKAPIKFGLVGCGAAGKIHAHAMQQSPGSELVAVSDTNSKAAEALARRHGVAAKELPALLADRQIDAISLAVPHDCHFEIACQAARAGKHLLVEKPFTRSVQEGRELVEVCREAGVVVVPWLERRYLPFVGQARSIVQSGRLGQIVYTRVCTLGYKPRAYWEYGMRMEEYPSTWRGSQASSGGGVLIMNAVHQIDLMTCVTDLQAVEVSAHTATLHHEVEVEDLAVATLRYASGALGVVEASCCTYGVNQFPIERPADVVMGVDGNLELGRHLKCFDRIQHAQTFESENMTVAEMKVCLLDNFAGHLQNGEPLRCSAEDALRALAVIEACYQSASQRAPVTVELV